MSTDLNKRETCICCDSVMDFPEMTLDHEEISLEEWKAIEDALIWAE